MYNTLFYPSYLQDIRVTTCQETSKNRLYSLFKPVYVPYILRATWGKVSVEVFAAIGKLRGEDGPPLEWFSSRGIIIYSILYTFRAFARSFALTRGTGYNTFYEYSTCYSTQE